VVGYPLLKLLPPRQDVRRYVRDLEECLIRTLDRFGIFAGRIPGWTGVWVGPGVQREPGNSGGDEARVGARKIAAIGVHLSRWQTSHGFALNVSPDLSHFGFIVPCGIREAQVTSMERELGRKVPQPEVEAVLAEELAARFDQPLLASPAPLKTISVAVIRMDGGERKVLLLRRTPERGGFWQLVTGRIESGESPAEAASRELFEETGARLEPEALGYQHSFAFGDGEVPQVCEETSFAATWNGAKVTLDPKEHAAFDWVTPEEAEARVPFKGLKVALRRATARS
jgi:lipoyl(octanoyl) transferase